MNTEIQSIIALLNSTFEKTPWHGPSVKEVLTGINQEQSFRRIGTSHTIIELVAHMTSWRIFVEKKLSGLMYEVSDEFNFPTRNDWEKVLVELHASQVALLQAIQMFPVSRLQESVPNSSYPYNYYTLLHGIIHHDLYHIGQIVLIKKSK